MKKNAGNVSFGVADHGVQWAIGELPDGRVVDGEYWVGQKPLTLAPLSKSKGEDGYAIRRDRSGFYILTNSAVGAISGIQCLGRMLREGGVRNRVVNLRLRTRNYKHEAALSSKHPRWVGHYSDDMWEALCRQLLSHQFNGLVFYAGYHPFEFFLDYREWPAAATLPEEDRAATRAALCRGLAIAHRYGLKTFLHHYVGHFTRGVAEAHQIPTTGRFSNTKHPVVEQYCRYCYRELFRQLPDLDGIYFNFESYPNAHEHVLATAIPEMNAMRRKPIVVFRLWGYTHYDGMKRMLKVYRGRVILGHKIMDTNDAYYLPVADSRVMEWKKRLGRKIEWMFLVGPCHNCGTNICSQLWADYEFVQKLLADAVAKGADSISFHAYVELFSDDLPDPKGLFTEHEKNLSRLNRLHVLAASDFVNRMTRSGEERIRAVAALNGCSPAAGKHLVEAIRSSSQLVLQIYQQFYMTSAYDGYLNPGRYSTIQEPFFYYPVSELNHQSRKMLFTPNWGGAWVHKSIDTHVVADGAYQRIIDYVDPSLVGKRAPLNPAVIARSLQQNIRTSRKELQAYEDLAGATAAAKLASYIEQNAVVGEYVRHEILAAIQFYSLYFARGRSVLVRALRNGLSELKAAANLISDRKSSVYKQLNRILLLTLKPEIQIQLAEELLRYVEAGSFSMPAFAAYVESHRRYNEIRRVIRPYRQLGAQHLRYARRCLDAAKDAADESLALGAADASGFHRVHAQAWRDYLVAARSETYAPQVICGKQDSAPFMPLHRETCFRAGEDFLEDFVSFFRPLDFARKPRLSIQVTHTRTELVVRLHEDGVGLGERRRRWLEYRGEGSDSYVMRIFVDIENRGRQNDMYIVWPVGGGVSCGPKLNLPASMEQQDHGASWDMIVRLPFKTLGRTPRKGETWGFNVTSNPFVARNACYTWASQYDANNPACYGKITFS